jgi:hypothetical protein
LAESIFLWRRCGLPSDAGEKVKFALAAADTADDAGVVGPEVVTCSGRDLWGSTPELGGGVVVSELMAETVAAMTAAAAAVVAAADAAVVAAAAAKVDLVAVNIVRSGRDLRGSTPELGGVVVGAELMAETTAAVAAVAAVTAAASVAVVAAADAAVVAAAATRVTLGVVNIVVVPVPVSSGGEAALLSCERLKICLDIFLDVVFFLAAPVLRSMLGSQVSLHFS